MSNNNTTEIPAPAQLDLLAALEEGDIAAAQKTLENGVDPNVSDQDGLTPLMWAAKIGSPDLTALLLDRGADLEAVDGDGWTALAWATSFGYNDTIRVLLERGANAHQADRYGVTVLMHAAADAGSKALNAILESGADINARDQDGDSALMWATRVGRLENVEILIQRGANLCIPDLDGETALIRSVRRGYTHITARLLEDGRIDINAQDVEGWTALMFAVLHSGSSQSIQNLLDHGADLGLKNKAGDTAERIASKACCLEVIPLLTVAEA